MRLGEARVPDGQRLYAIGDIHGCDNLLAEIHAKITSDISARPPRDYRIIHLGDYVDRGESTAAVIERLCEFCTNDERVLCLRGNHEQMLLDFLADPEENGAVWLMNGGDRTLASYGVNANRWQSKSQQKILFGKQFAIALPSSHRDFLNALNFSVRFGDFFFCHAGIRPDVAIETQDPVDLTWIREEFLQSDVDFGAVVVHGHTPQPEPEIRPNRINIDTGAVFSGTLTCLVLEGTSYRFL